jgi:tetratricopeptide (TPR) repeat protein
MKKPELIIEDFYRDLKNIPDEKEKIRFTFEFILVYGDTFGEKLHPVLAMNLEAAKRNNYEAAEAVSYLQYLFFTGLLNGSNTGAAENEKWADVPNLIQKTVHDPFMNELASNLLAYYYWFRGNYEKGFNTIFEIIKVSEKKKDWNLAWHYYALAVFYFDTKDFKNSHFYYQLGKEIFDKQNHPYGSARSSNGLASVLIAQGHPEKALPLLKFASETYREIGHASGLSRSLNDLGLIEKANKNYKRALEIFNESIELRKELGHTQGLITSYTETGETLLLMGNYEQALSCLLQAIDLSEKIQATQKSVRLHKLLSETYKKCNDVVKALFHFEAFYTIQSRIMSDEASNNIKSLHTRFEKEKSEKEAEIERFKNIELKKANDLIAEKNKEILDSIKYAKRIQTSLITSEKYIEKTVSRLNKNQEKK